MAPFLSYLRLISFTFTFIFGNALAFIFFVPNVKAAPESCAPVNLVIVRDQSGSMGGPAYGGAVAATDPQGVRFQAAAFAVDYLATLQRTYAGSSPEGCWDVRINVIDFGGAYASVPTLQWTVANAHLPADDPASVAALRQRLSAEAFGPRNLGNTDHLAALEAAITQLEGTDQAPGGYRGVLLLTDGAPCVDATQPLCYLESQPRSGLDQMLDVKSLIASRLNNPNDHFWVLGLDQVGTYWSGEADGVNYGEQWSEAVGIRGFAERLARDVDMTYSVQRAIDELVGPLICHPADASACPGLVSDTLEVAPYLSKLILVLHKSTVSDQVQFTVGGQVVDLEPLRSQADRLVEIVEIPDPTPGVWEVLRPGTVTISRREQIDLKASFAGGERVILTCGQPQPLTIRVTTVDGTPLVERPEYPLTARMTIEWPDGHETLVLTPSGAGVYSGTVKASRSSSDLPVQLALAVTAFGQERELFGAEIGRLAVNCEPASETPSPVATVESEPTAPNGSMAAPLATEVCAPWLAATIGLPVLALLSGLAVYTLALRPRQRPRLQGELVLQSTTAGMRRPQRTMTSLLPRARHAVAKDELGGLEDFADELYVRQDAARWDRIWITAMVDGVAQAEEALLPGERLRLPARAAQAPDATLEYDIGDIGDAELTARARRRRERAATLWLGGATLLTALLLAGASWLFVPGGC